MHQTENQKVKICTLFEEHLLPSQLIWFLILRSEQGHKENIPSLVYVKHLKFKNSISLIYILEISLCNYRTHKSVDIVKLKQMWKLLNVKISLYYSITGNKNFHFVIFIHNGKETDYGLIYYLVNHLYSYF